MIAFPQLTYPGLLLAVFANQICLPIPSIVFLMAAGALSARGTMHTSIIVLAGVSGCLAADWIWFWFGRKWGSQSVRLLCRFTADPRRCATHAHQTFRRYGLRVLCVAKFFPGLDAVTPPLAGAEGASAPVFLAFDAVGSFLWCGFYVALGYLFSRQLDVAIVWVKHFGSVFGAVIGLPILFYAAWRGLALKRMIRKLRLRRIGPAMLDRKLKSQKKIAVIDLLNFEEETDDESPDAIPGAMRIDPFRLRDHPRISVPDDVEVILYSSSGGNTVSARAALALQRVGVNKVWVLEGGLQAWREHGLPVSRFLDEPEVIAARLGIKLPGTIAAA